MDNKLREARGLLAEISGMLEVYSLWAEPIAGLSVALKDKANRIEKFLKGGAA